CARRWARKNIKTLCNQIKFEEAIL
ncbi:TPA: hypothetical protein ACIWDO_004318, partial [Salmonella enterica subsp. enterica serovar Saintpaul]